MAYSMNYYTKSVLFKESEIVQLAWLENDKVEGIDSEHAKRIITSLKTPRTLTRKPVINEFKGEVSRTLYTITMSVYNFDAVEAAMNYLQSVGVVVDYKAETHQTQPLGHASFSFYLQKGLAADGHYAAATKVTNGLVKALGSLSPDYRFSFMESQVC